MDGDTTYVLAVEADEQLLLTSDPNSTPVVTELICRGHTPLTPDNRWGVLAPRPAAGNHAQSHTCFDCEAMRQCDRPLGGAGVHDLAHQCNTAVRSPLMQAHACPQQTDHHQIHKRLTDRWHGRTAINRRNTGVASYSPQGETTCVLTELGA
jgi:hypothetical protein